MSYSTTFFLQNLLRQRCLATVVPRYFCSPAAAARRTESPADYFQKDDVQALLKSLQPKIEKTAKFDEGKTKIQFMTTEEIERISKTRMVESDGFLDMPPIVPVLDYDCVKVSHNSMANGVCTFSFQIEASPEIYAENKALKGFSDATWSFMEITNDHNVGKQYTIVERTPDGTLKTAPINVQKRMKQIFYPTTGRTIKEPTIFEPQNLEFCLNEFKYKFILDRLCIQYEPYEEPFAQISGQVYEHINKNKRFDDLHHTRYYTSLIFYLAWNNLIDDIVFHLIKQNQLNNAVSVIGMMQKLNNHPIDQLIINEIDNLSHMHNLSMEICKNVIMNFIKSHAVKKAALLVLMQNEN